MAIARAKAGLSTAEVETLRSLVNAGRKPKVMFTAAAGQIAGRTGQVTRLEDPGASEEWVVVKFGKDELPFAPTDLKFPEPRPAQAKTVERVETIEPPQWTPPAAAAPEPARAAAKPATEVVSAATAVRPAARKTVAKRPAELTVTLSCLDGQWSVQAHRGAKALVKSVSLRAADALKMVAQLDAPPVQAVVEEIVETARVEAEQQAERLRKELAEVEAALADLRELS